MLFSEDYLKTEIREGFEVSFMMKRAWAATLEVLEAIDSVCKKNNIKYFAAFGTMLGAVRHKGFIPWDDDIDLFMLREDYDRFIKLAGTELPKGFVLAGMYADSHRLQQACFVPQSRVIADETLWNFNDYMVKFHGFPYQRIGIDIFPLDNVSESQEILDLQYQVATNNYKLLANWDNLEKTGQLEEMLRNIEKICNVSIPRNESTTNYIWRLGDAVISLAHTEKTEKCAWLFFHVKDKHLHFPKEWFSESIDMPFENTTIPVPAEYDKILTATFGDYMTPQKFTADHDYPFYGHMEAELIKQIKAVGFTGNVEEFCIAVGSGRLRV